MTHEPENVDALAPHPDMVLCGFYAYLPFRISALSSGADSAVTDAQVCDIFRDYANLSAADRRGWEAHGCAQISSPQNVKDHEERTHAAPPILTEKRSNYLGTLIFVLVAIWTSVDLVNAGQYIWAIAALIGLGGLLPLAIILLKRQDGGAQSAGHIIDRSLNILEGFGEMSARMAGFVVNILSMRKLTVIFIVGFFALALFLGYFGKELTP